MKWKGKQRYKSKIINETGFIFIFSFFLAVHSSSPLSFNHDGSLQYCMIVFKEWKKEAGENNKKEEVKKINGHKKKKY